MIASAAAPRPALAQEGPGIRPDATMLQFPDVSADSIVFAYANDLWIVPRAGGQARRLASPPGPETFPRFSPDGQTIAFVGNYDGNRDLYTIAASADRAGTARRITHHPASEMLSDWSPDGRTLIFSSNGLAGLARQTQMFSVPAVGGMPARMPVPYGTSGAVSPDGQWLAYTPHTTDFRTWKRYRGGMATDIWLFNLRTNESRRMTDWEGTDTQPMWSPDGRTVYYLADQGSNHRMNIWAYTLATGERRQITDFDEFDCRFPSIGPGGAGGEIVFQNGARLYLLDCASGQSRPVDIVIPGDRPTLRAQSVNFADFLTRSVGVSPSGKRVLIEARGDLWSLPAEKGASMNLTRTSGVAERDPQWSPDGKWIAYLSDESGEYEVYLRNADWSGQAVRLTTSTPGGVPDACYKYMTAWSPDSRKLVFGDKAGRFFLHTLGENGAAGTTELFASDISGRPSGVSWSGDSRWIALSMQEPNVQNAVFLYNTEDRTLSRVTDPMFNSTAPAFDRKGEYLYFVSHRSFFPQYSDIDGTFIYSDSEVVLVVPLRKDVKSPLLPRNDAEEPKKDEPAKDEKKDDEQKDGEKNGGEGDDAAPAEGGDAAAPKADDAKDAKKKDDAPKPVVIDLDGFEMRAVQLPHKPGNYSALSVTDSGKLVYIAGGKGSRSNPNPKGDLKIFDPADEKREEKTIASGIDSYQMTADGKKLLVRKGNEMWVVDAAPDQKLEKKVPTDAMTMSVEPRDEWRQMFNEVWRLQRDFFYDPGLHGVDWEAVKRRYEPMLADCVSRDDLSFVIREMISELNVGHAYYNVDTFDKAPNVNVGMLGCDFELGGEGDARAYRISRIFRGGAWDTDARSPLAEPGIDVKEGDYLLAVNGVPVDVSKDPWAAFQALADRVVALTVSDKPVADGTQRQVIVKTMGSENTVRYRDWIEQNRAYVEARSGGTIGYCYVPNTGVDGQNDLYRQFYGQRDKAGMIIDERWNGGGQIPNRFIELLNRPRTNYWAKRDGRDWAWPYDSHQGPKAMLANGLAGSGGDMFPALFKMMKIGPVIGTRTWGGLVGISGNPQLIDGTAITVPTFGYYKTDGNWGIEGHGVDPDIEVIDDPAKMVTVPGRTPAPAMGGDPQLDAAIEWVQAEIRRNPYTPPQRPKGPDRRGMGIREEEK